MLMQVSVAVPCGGAWWGILVRGLKKKLYLAPAGASGATVFGMCVGRAPVRAATAHLPLFPLLLQMP